MRDITPLCQLAQKHETDKGGRHLRYGGGDSDTCHEYTPVYWDLLHKWRGEVKGVLEIGVNAGSSLRMWEEFFPNARIVGFDNRNEVLFKTDRIGCFYADQGSQKSLASAITASGVYMYDLIIDDGSHMYEHQVLTMQTLLPYLSERGFYVIEDIQVDCHPEWLGNLCLPGYEWRAYKTDMGIGKAHCPCLDCEGKGVEQLVVVRRKSDAPWPRFS